MAKTRGFVAMMKAKPNARGKTSHLPITCSCGKCDEDFLVLKAGKPNTRKCRAHFFNTTTEKGKRQDATIAKLKSMGLL